MTTTPNTFDEWFATFTTHYFGGLWPNQRFGQAFSNEIYALSPTLGGALTTFKDDPFYRTDSHICDDVKNFLRRNWSLAHKE